LPDVAVLGTGTAMLVALQAEGVATVPLKVTVPVPWVAPKFAPVIVTDVPAGPPVGDKPLIAGAGTVTVKLDPLLACPPTVTTTLPVVAPEGAGTAMEVALQLVGVAVVPLNFTVLVPCVVPQFAPAMVTGVPIGPEPGDKLLMLGTGAVTVKFRALLGWPATVTITLPVTAPAGTGAVIDVALQLVGLATAPLNVTVLVV